MPSFQGIMLRGKHGTLLFVRFATCREAETTIDMAVGRSWGGRRIQAILAKFQSRKIEGKI